MIDDAPCERKLWHRGTLKKNRCQKYLVEDKKVIASGDIPLGAIPLPAALALDNADYKLIETWNFVNELFDELKRAEPHEVRKLKKLRRKIAGPMLLGLHLILCIVAHKFKWMKDNMSEQEFEVSPEFRIYTEAADPVWHRFDVVSTTDIGLVECWCRLTLRQWSARNESIQQLMNGFEPFGVFNFAMYAEHNAKLLWDLQREYEADGRSHNVRLGSSWDRRGFKASLRFIEKYFKLIVAYAEWGPKEFAERGDKQFFRSRLEEEIPNKLALLEKQEAALRQ